MKRNLLLTVLLTMVTLMGWSQNIAYILPSDCSYADGKLTGFPSETTGFEACPTQTPELNAATWFKENYVDKGKGTFLPIAQVAATDLSKYDLIWAHVERTAMPDKSELKGKYGFDDAVVTALKSYVQAGGNLYLSKAATFLAYYMGRIGYAPTFENAGNYEQKNSDDWWCTQALLGSGLDAASQTDRTGHAIFTGLEKTTNSDYWHNAFKMTNAEVRTSNIYCSWIEFLDGDQQKKYGNSNKQLLTDFESAWNARCLSQRGNIADYCFMDIVEFLPGTVNDVNWKGTILCNGSNHCQWAKCNDGTIPAPITTLAGNVMNYLTKNIVLYEGRNIDYPSAFTANVKLEREFTANTKSTIILPFALNETQCAACGDFYQLSKVGDNSIVFSPVTSTEANKPYMFVSKSTGTLPAFESVEVEPTAGASLATAVTGATMTGSYTTQTLADARTNGYYTYYDNSFVTTTGSITVSPFRAYVKLDKASPAKMSVLLNGSATGIFTIKSDTTADNAYYTLGGIRVAKPVKGIYIHQGKKVIIK
ncbi:MAG: DUF4960 domain-containing protein [Prevotella sp.]|nr:DUF4960 domain-containing protein [Prevotella sp.]